MKNYQGISCTEMPLKRQVEYAAIAVEAQERERTAIGMELHDNVNQILVSTKILLSAVETRSASDTSLLVACMQNLQMAIDENRKLSHDMMAPDFKGQKLSEQIRSVAETMFRPAAMKVKFDCSGLDEVVLQPDQKLAIYRIAQEQCTNIAKHSKAKSVKIVLNTTRNKFYMEIADNGIGIQPGKKANGIGLQNIKNRLTALRGTSHINSEPGKGFTLEVELPLAV